MRHQTRRYCFSLAERLGCTVAELLNKIDSQELAEWVAYDRTNDEDWSKAYIKECERLKSSQASDEAKTRALKSLFGVNR